MSKLVFINNHEHIETTPSMMYGGASSGFLKVRCKDKKHWFSSEYYCIQDRADIVFTYCPFCSKKFYEVVENE